MTIYPKIDEVIDAHDRLVATFGGIAGIRDRGGLESAVARPRTGYYQDLIQEAAALWESLSQNHPFLDGNKRIAVTVAIAFLRVNGCVVEFDDVETHRFLLDRYESGSMRFPELEAWLRSPSAPGRRP